MSVNNKPYRKRAPGLVKSEVIHQEPIFFFTFLSAVINISALSSDYFYYSCKIAEAHLSFTYKFNNAQWEKRSSLLKHLFLRMQKHFPRSLSGFSHTYHLFELYYMPIPKSITGKGSGTSLPWSLEGREVTWTKSSLHWQRRWCKIDSGREQQYL